MEMKKSEYRPSFIRDAEEWEIIGFCPNCKISMMFFEVDYERGWAAGRYCPNCHFIHDPYGGGHGESGDGKLLKISICHDVRLEEG